MKKILPLILLLSFLVFNKLSALTYTVTSTSDASTGAGTSGTLRWCITQANLTAAADIINFNLGTGGPYTLTVATELPTIIYPLTINGFSNPNSIQGQLGTGSRVYQVILNGPGNSTVKGITITANNCVISGLVIQDFFKGIYIDGGDNNWIWGCYIGTSADGLSSSNATACYDDGIDLENNADNNIIGTNGDGSNDANEGNLIAGNGDGGVQFLGECITLNEIGMVASKNCTGNRISGNFLGTNETGTAALYFNATASTQRGSGIQINFSRLNIIGTNGDGISDALERNVISGNSDNGILLWGACNNKIKGNYIGTSKTGLAGIPNYVDGGANIAAVAITMRTNSDSNYVGTDGDGLFDNIEGNVIGTATITAGSANSYNYGIVVTSTSARNRIAGNYIGIGADGNTALKFMTTGGSYVEKAIYVRNSSNNCIIGTNGDGISDALEANYIGNSGNGLTLELVSNCVVAGNYFGLGSNLTTSQRLDSTGVFVLNSTSCRIGSSGFNDLERNYFSYIGYSGVWVDGGTTANNDLINIRYNTFGIRPDGVAAANGYHAIEINKRSNADTIQYNIITENGTYTPNGTYSAVLVGGLNATEESIGCVIFQNQIYRNMGRGVDILGDLSVRNKVSQNSIYNNGNAASAGAGGYAFGKYSVGLDNGWDGTTANDNKDTDSGPNDYLNFPVITGTSSAGTGCVTATISGTYHGLPGTQFFVELFSSDVCNGDTDGNDYYTNSTYNYGEGRTYIGTSATFTTVSNGGSAGNGTWSTSVPLTIAGKYITAVAVQVNGTNAGNTSEFSQCVPLAFDAGDAPDSYSTLLSSCGPAHFGVSTNLKIGSTIDADGDGIPSVNADGDGADEDGITTFPALSILTTSYTLTNIPVTNTTGSSATLYAWIDFNVNGSFEASEFTSASVANGATTVTLTWDLSTFVCGTTLKPGVSYVRLRLTSDVLADNTGTTTIDERCSGRASNGEVEDYKIYIAGYDYGDITISYPIAKALVLENTATSKVWAGVNPPTMECTQKFSANALGDGDEEDGLTTSISGFGTTNNWVIRLNANQPNKTVYYGLWQDWNGNGIFNVGIDGFNSGSAVVNGVTNVNVSVYAPNSFSYTSLFRLIVSDAPLTSAMFNATIANGEVEDWLLYTILAAPNNILTGKTQSSTNILKWKNSQGISITNFQVERSTDNLSYTLLGSVTPSTGNTVTEYSFIDFKPQLQNYYRLKIYLADGSFHYSNILPLFDNSNILPVLLFPNPAVNKLTIQTTNSNYVSLKIFDLTGRLHLTQQIKSAITEVDISNIAAGTHVIKFIQKNGAEQVQRFVKIK